MQRDINGHDPMLAPQSAENPASLIASDRVEGTPVFRLGGKRIGDTLWRRWKCVIGQHVHKSACRRVFHAAIYRENGAGFCITR